MSRFFSNFLAFTMLACAMGGCNNTESTNSETDVPQDAHSRMIALLSEIKERTPDEDRYQGDLMFRRFQLEFDQLPSHAPDEAKSFLNFQLGLYALRLGRNEMAVKHAQASYDFMRAAGAKVTSDNAELVTMKLAMAYMRLGETENCVHHNNGESCLLPIRGKGVHTKRRGSQNAVKYFEIVLAKNPEQLTARWLLNIAYMTLGRFPQDVPGEYLIPAEKFESQVSLPRFQNVSADLGLDTISLCGGSIADDFDGDGFLDIVVSTWDTSGVIRYFKNNGDGTFIERTDDAGFAGLFGGLNIIQADYDNDGDLDILVLRGAWLGNALPSPNSLLQNDGSGHFRDVTFDVGLGDVHYSTQAAAWSDFDNDGDLDLYIGNEGFPSQLFQNQGDGTFVDVAAQAGVLNNRFSKAVSWGDYNGDRFPDLYVSNMNVGNPTARGPSVTGGPDSQLTNAQRLQALKGGANRLYRNNGDGTFSDVAPKLNVTEPSDSFPAWFWDFNNDGSLDIFVAGYATTVDHLAAEYLGIPHKALPDCLYQGDGKGGFRNVAAQMGLPRATEPMGYNFGDFDYDGFPDFYLGTGNIAFEALMPNLMFHNQRGKKFVNVSTTVGLGHLQKGHGVAFADFDHDGDQDIFIELGGAFPGDGFANALFENPGFGNHWIKIRLVGRKSNHFGIGARIRAEIVEDGKRRNVYKWVNSGGGFGANPLRQEIGLGRATIIETLEIFWPTSGETQTFRNIKVDQLLEITEGENKPRVLMHKVMQFKRPVSAEIPFDSKSGP